MEDGEGRDFTLAIHLSAVGEGTQKLERQNRGWERGREAEKMETEGDTKMRNDRERLCCGCAHSRTTLQAPCRFLPLPAASSRDMQDLPRRSWIGEQIV